MSYNSNHNIILCENLLNDQWYQLSKLISTDIDAYIQHGFDELYIENKNKNWIIWMWRF